MKSIISKAVLATAVVSCLTLGLHAKSLIHSSSNAASVALRDTGKMSKDKMKMDKMKKKKMSKDKMKMDKKMAKDSTGKM